MSVTFTQETNANAILSQYTPCDSCEVRSSYVILKENDVILSFCAHHTRKNAPKLKATYTIFPDSYEFAERKTD